ncbi:hypothetical protein ACJJTC_005420 [Scirpophaga incertulas]
MSTLPTLMSSIKAIQTDIADLRSVTDMADLKLLKPELEAVKVSVRYVQDTGDGLNGRISETAQEVQGLLKINDQFQILQQRFQQLKSETGIKKKNRGIDGGSVLTAVCRDLVAEMRNDWFSNAEEFMGNVDASLPETEISA